MNLSCQFFSARSNAFSDSSPGEQGETQEQIKKPENKLNSTMTL